MTKRFVNGIKVTRETLARQVIEDVGPGGHFLVQKHTMNHFKEELWNSTLMNHQTIDAWHSAGAPTMADRVREEIRKITDTHKPEPLSDKVLAELDRLKREGEKEILAKLEKG
jgi:trimethylamine--corrinoid protein Co-methyltransferase